jgi:hypothetical protein
MSDGDGQELGFERVEGVGEGEAASVCKSCGAPIRHAYFQVNGEIVCSACKGKAVAAFERGSPVTRFLRAAAFGGLAAAGGALLWYAIGKLTGYEFGLIAIVVGFMVGGAVRVGSCRRGGWAYQALAVFLTYAAIVSTYIPQIVEFAMEQEVEAVATGSGREEAEAGEVEVATLAERAGDEPSASVYEKTAAAGHPAEVSVGLGGALLGIAALFAIAFMAPFFGGFEGILGWVILGIGLYEAWKLNRRGELVVEGPFRLAGARPEYAPEPPPPPIQP